jgi:hypothetical protein
MNFGGHESDPIFHPKKLAAFIAYFYCSHRERKKELILWCNSIRFDSIFGKIDVLLRQIGTPVSDCSFPIKILFSLVLIDNNGFLNPKNRPIVIPRNIENPTEEFFGKSFPSSKNSEFRSMNVEDPLANR